VIEVTPRAHRHDDRNGDPLDGLVNMFDIGIVLAVAFLLAALSSLHLTSTLTRTGLAAPAQQTVSVPKDQQVKDLPRPGQKTIGRGSKVGTVYRLQDGRLVYVAGAASPSASPSAGATTSPAASPTTGP
jgi:hypothetical protein